jgi:DNA-binding NarL/FixJ family response regulator
MLEGVCHMMSSLITAASSGVSEPDHEVGTVCIAWIDVSALTRECLTHAVKNAQRMFMIVPFSSVYDCIKECERKLDLIVYHAHEANSVNAADIAALREAFATTQLVVLSDATNLDPAIVKDVLAQGASGFILTSQTGLQMMVSALGMVASGGSFVPREVLFYQAETKTLTAREKRKGTLTAREVEVLQLLKQGKPNKLIAYELKLSESTVKVHIRNTMRKVGSTNRTHAAMYADKYMEAIAA